jgi:hypothetical protein
VRRLALAAAAALAAAGCSSPGGAVIGGFRGPQAVAAFMGVNPMGGTRLAPLLAIAASRGDELRIVDPASDQVVRSPNVAYPLAVPTLPRPIHLAAASLGDGGADVLVVASGGSTLQLVSTWLDGLAPGGSGAGVVATWDLEPVVGKGSQILALAGAAVPGGPAGGDPPVAPAAAGKAWILVGLSGGIDGLGGKLAVLEFARGPGGTVELAAAPAVKVLGFEPAALAPSPDNHHVYCGTPDVIQEPGGRQVQGVAELDASGGLGAAWPVRGLDGRGPTSAVAAAILGERGVPGNDFGPPVARVYAALDPSGCGPQRPIACGIATFDPALGGLAADPSTPGPVPGQSYRAPLYVPALPFTLAVGMPPAAGPLRCVAPLPAGTAGRCPDGVNEAGAQQALMALATASGQTWTTAAMVVAAANGNSYVLDLGRFAPANDALAFGAATSTKVTAAEAVDPASGPSLGLYAPIGAGLLPEPGASLVHLPKELPGAIGVWPGFTPADRFTLAWQGPLPGLLGRPVTLGRLSDGALYLAFQQPVGTEWDVKAFVGSPELGIHAADAWPAGDIAQFGPAVEPGEADRDPCPLPKDQEADPAVLHEAGIQSILPPDPVLHPGGALRLATPQPGSDLACLSDALAASPGKTFQWFANVRASGLVLSGALLGYAGRPELGRRYELAWKDEAGVSGEALVLARKARRIFYPWCSGSDCSQAIPGMEDQLQPGPVLAFRAGVYCPDAASCGLLPTRDAAIRFDTQSGMQPMARRPPGVAQGTAAVSFDKSSLPGQEGLGRVFYVTYVGDALLMLPPGRPADQSRAIR